MEGLFLKVKDEREGQDKIRISQIRFNEGSAASNEKRIPIGRWIPIIEEPVLEGDDFTFIRCPHCGHSDFSISGGGLYDFECNSCDKTIAIYPR